MKTSSRWFNYIILNIFISALVTGTLIFFYDRYQRAQQKPVSLPDLSATQGQPADNSNLQLEIVSVIGAGLAETEIVVLQNKGPEAVLLTGWIMDGSSGASFTFPSVKIFPNGILQIHSTSGADSPVDLYWGRTQPAWNSADTVSLLDTAGSLITTYTIP